MLALQSQRLLPQFSNMRDEDVQLMVALAGDIRPKIYPRWGADASEALLMETYVWDTKCPSKVCKLH